VADEQDVLLREIEEDLKQERLEKLWNTYGNYAIAGALAIVIGVAGAKAWQSYDLDQRMQQGERFADAAKLANDGKAEDALGALNTLGQNADAGYAMLARFRAAAVTGKNGDPAGAAKLYAALADDSGIDAVYRELAVVLGALQELDAGAGGDLVARAGELASGGSPWKHNAREVQALAALGSGDMKTAGTIFKELAETAGAPQGVRSRANEMLAITGMQPAAKTN